MEMASKKFFYIKICVLVILFSGLVIILIFNDISRDKKRLSTGQSRLISGDLEGANECFKALSRSWWVGNPARLGKILIKILNGEKHYQDALPEKSKIKISDFNFPILLSQQLASAEYEKCLELSKIGLDYGENKSRLFYPASLLELGKIDEARDEFSQLDSLQKSSEMGERLRETLMHIKPGTTQIVRDRNGLIIGTVGDKNEFEFAKDDFSQIIRHRYIKEVLKQSNRGGKRLSLDLELSRMAKNSLGNRRGSIVLILVKTGEIVKAVTGYGGTAEWIAPYDFPVAMKTGTGGNYRDGFHINYIGYAPADQPYAAFCVRITHQRNSYRARRNGYETSYKLFQGLRHIIMNRKSKGIME